MPTRIILLFTLTVLLRHVAFSQTKIVIESLPQGTSSADTIFICGSFNNWVPNDAHFMLEKQLNGYLSITLPFKTSGHEYKFTRGSWTKVETDEANRYTANRTFEANEKEVYVRIINWLDQGGVRKINYTVFYFFACFLQTIVLLFLINRIQKKDHVRYNVFLVANGALALLWLLPVLYETANQIWQSYFIFFAQVSFFCWGPLVYYFITGMQHRAIAKKYWRVMLLPALLIFLFELARIFNVQQLHFLSRSSLLPFQIGTLGVLVGGVLFNGSLFWILFRTYRFRIQLFREQNPRGAFLSRVYIVNVVALLMIPIHILLLAAGSHISFIEDFHGVGMVLSALIFIETYFLWRYPELLKEEKVNTIIVDQAQLEWVNRLTQLMTEEKPFKNPELTLSDLAKMLDVKPHVLSRIINDHHQKNFRDFVNAYRVEEFITLVNTPTFKNYTFLAIAQEVGFNSKSTFNLAFKKLTQQNPSDYFKKHEL